MPLARHVVDALARAGADVALDAAARDQQDRRQNYREYAYSMAHAESPLQSCTALPEVRKAAEASPRTVD